MGDELNKRTRTVSWSDPMITAQAAMNMDALAFLQAIMEGDIPAPPIAELMGFRLVEVAEGRAVFEVEPAEYHYNPIGVVHGGLPATLLDSALGVAAHSIVARGMMYTTTQLNINLVRALTKDTGTVRAEATVLHAGRSLITAEAYVRDVNGKLYAHGTTTCFVYPIPQGG